MCVPLALGDEGNLTPGTRGLQKISFVHDHGKSFLAAMKIMTGFYYLVTRLADLPILGQKLNWRRYVLVHIVNFIKMSL